LILVSSRTLSNTLPRFSLSTLIHLTHS
jgi:hypothetical protein